MIKSFIALLMLTVAFPVKVKLKTIPQNIAKDEHSSLFYNITSDDDWNICSILNCSAFFFVTKITR